MKDLTGHEFYGNIHKLVYGCSHSGITADKIRGYEIFILLKLLIFRDSFIVLYNLPDDKRVFVNKQFSTPGIAGKYN